MRHSALKCCLGAALLQCTFTVYAQKKTDRLQTTSFKMEDVHVTGGPFKYAEDKEAEYLLKLDPDRFLSGFRSEAGLEPKAPKYPGWESDGVAGQTTGHHVSACALHYAATKDPRFLKRINYMIDEFDLCQKANGNGYLAATPDGKRIFREVSEGNIYSQGFDLNGGWVPIYVMHKVMAGLIDAYQYAGNQKALAIATSLGDWMYVTFNHLSEDKMQLVLACEFGGMNEALANLYGLTQNPKYLELAKKFDNNKAVMDPLFAQHDELEGKHANTQVPKIVGAARLYELTGSKRDSIVSTYFWNTVVHNHTYVNGGNSDGEHFGAPGKLNDRLGTSTTETCNTYNMLKLTEHLFAWNPDIRYTNYYERALYNQILGSQNPEIGTCSYYTPLVSGSMKGYTGFEHFTCCSGTGMENHMKYGAFIYSKGSDGSLFVNLFIPSELNWEEAGIRLRQDTEIPSSNTTLFTLSCRKSVKKNIRIRYPYWASSAQIFVNGEPVQNTASSDSYLSLERKWNNGDRIEVRFELNMYTVSMPDNPNRVGIFYGPVLLAGELGKEEPDMATGIPVLVTDGRPVQEWLVQTSGYPLRFRTNKVGEPSDATLIPFYSMHFQHHMVYWDLFTREQWDKEQAAYKEELRRMQELDKITVDFIALGEMQPERDHNLKGHSIGNGVFNKKKWRAAWNNGWFSFDMKVLPDKPMTLLITYWGGETPEKEFTISVDDQVLAIQKVHNNKPGSFFEIPYSLPAELTSGKEKITIRFDGKPTWTGAIYHARIIQ